MKLTILRRFASLALVFGMIGVAAVVWAAAAAINRTDERAQGQAPPAASPVGPFERVGCVDGEGPSWRSPFSRDGSAFITEKDDVVRIWDARALKPLTAPLRHAGVEYYRLTGDGKTVFTAGGKEVKLWDVATSKLLSATKVTEEKLRFADVSPDGKRFVTVGSEDIGIVGVWRAGEKRPAMSLRHRFAVTSAEFDPTGSRIVTHEYGRSFHLWAADTGREVCPPIASDDDYFTADRAEFDPSGRRLVVAQNQGFTLVEPATGKILAAVRFDGAVYTNNVRFSADGAKIAIATRKWLEHGPVRVFDAASGKQQLEFGSGLIDCRIGSGGRWALCNADRNASAYVPELWNLATGVQVQTFAQSGSGDGMSPDGSLILIESKPGVTAIWRLRQSEERNG